MPLKRRHEPRNHTGSAERVLGKGKQLLAVLGCNLVDRSVRHRADGKHERLVVGETLYKVEDVHQLAFGGGRVPSSAGECGEVGVRRVKVKGGKDGYGERWWW